MEITICSCHSAEHQILTDYDKDYNQLDVQIHLVTHRNFFKRIWIALKYIFGYKCRYGNWDSIIINSENKHILLSELAKIEND